METTSQRLAPSATVEHNTPRRDENKSMVVDSVEAEQTYNFKVDPLMKKSALEIEAMR